MRLSLTRNSEAESHKRQTSLKRLSIVAGFVRLPILLALTTKVLSRQLSVQIGNEDCHVARSGTRITVPS